MGGFLAVYPALCHNLLSGVLHIVMLEVVSKGRQKYQAFTCFHFQSSLAQFYNVRPSGSLLT